MYLMQDSSSLEDFVVQSLAMKPLPVSGVCGAPGTETVSDPVQSIRPSAVSLYEVVPEKGDRRDSVAASGVNSGGLRRSAWPLSWMNAWRLISTPPRRSDRMGQQPSIRVLQACVPQD
jgi:hypothetical protein